MHHIDKSLSRRKAKRHWWSIRWVVNQKISFPFTKLPLWDENYWSFLFQWWWTLVLSHSRTKCQLGSLRHPQPVPRVTWPGLWAAWSLWWGTWPGHRGTPGGRWDTRRGPWTGSSTPWTRSTATWCPETGTRSWTTRPDLIISGDKRLEIILTSRD